MILSTHEIRILIFEVFHLGQNLLVFFKENYDIPQPQLNIALVYRNL